MALLKLPKRFDPYLGLPGRKPVGPVEIDWSNPLTRGLKLCWIATSPHAELVTGQKTTLAAPISTLLGSRMAEGDGSTSSEVTLPSVTLNTSATFLFECYRRSDVGGSSDYVFDHDNATTRTLFYNNAGSANYEFFIGGSGAGTVAVSSMLPVGERRNLGIVWDQNATTKEVFYSSGSSVGTANFSRAGTYNFTPHLLERYTATSQLDGGVGYFYYYDRPLTNAEVAALNKDPYQILKPANDLVYFTPSGAGGAFTLNADSGAYTVTGSSANLEWKRNLAATSGSYAVTGSDVTLTVGTAGSYTLVAESGSYTVTGSSANLEHHRVISAASGAYTVTGSPANLEHNRLLSADSGAYTVTGSSVALTKTYILTADPGSYVYTGSNANLIVEELRTPDCFTWLLSGISEASYLNSEIDNSALYVESTIDDSATFLTSEIKEALYLTGELCS